MDSTCSLALSLSTAMDDVLGSAVDTADDEDVDIDDDDVGVAMVICCCGDGGDFCADDGGPQCTTGGVR